MGIYARENGQGMVFDAEEISEDTPPEDPPPSPPKAEKRPALKIVR
jgi:stringent starvation protein B